MSDSTERAKFEAWCDKHWDTSAYLHKSRTCGEWAAWQAARQRRSKQTSLRDIPLHTKQEWQGLTDDDVHELTKNVIAFKSDVVKFIREAETKLKEKNGG